MKDFLTFKYIFAAVACFGVLGAEFSHLDPKVLFIVSCAALIPLAGIIGQSTEMLAEHTGPKIGGFLNATLGNAAELIITIVALRQGLVELVKASIIGSAVGNLLFVLGMSMLLGGIRHGPQKFNKLTAEHNATMLFSIIFLFSIPTIFILSAGDHGEKSLNGLSLGVAIGMLAVYGIGMFYAFTTASHTPLTRESTEHGHDIWSVKKSGIVLVVSTFFVVLVSETLVGSIEPLLKSYPFITEFFLGFIIIPIVGNIAEHIVAVQVSYKNNDMMLSMEIAIGSSMQILLFVAPALVLLSLFFDHRLDLGFNIFEWAAVIGTCVIVSRVSSDGETNYFEGAVLIILYIIMAWACFMLPSVQG